MCECNVKPRTQRAGACVDDLRPESNRLARNKVMIDALERWPAELMPRGARDNWWIV